VSAEEPARLARSVLETSAMLSAAHGCDTDVLYSHCGEVPTAARAEALRQLAQECHVGIHSVRILDGDPESKLPAALREGQYDVLTMGALTHQPGLARMVGRLTSRLVDAADCDFVLVKPEGLLSGAGQQLPDEAQELLGSNGLAGHPQIGVGGQFLDRR
jgi:nucleotide-binding universal stress UspA family protein